MSRESLLADFVVAVCKVFFGDNSQGIVPYNPTQQLRTRVPASVRASSELRASASEPGPQLPKPAKPGNPSISPPGSKQEGGSETKRVSVPFTENKQAQVSFREAEDFSDFSDFGVCPRLDVGSLFQLDDDVCPISIGDKPKVTFSPLDVQTRNLPPVGVEDQPLDPVMVYRLAGIQNPSKKIGVGGVNQETIYFHSMGIRAYTPENNRSSIVKFEQNILQRKMSDHGQDFFIVEPKRQNKPKLEQFERNLRHHISRSQEVFGTFRKMPVIHYFDYESRRNVIVHAENRSFISGYILTVVQKQRLIKNGSLGLEP